MSASTEVNILDCFFFFKCLAECQTSLGLFLMKGFIPEVLLKMPDSNCSSLTTLLIRFKEKFLLRLQDRKTRPPEYSSRPEITDLR